MENLSIQVAKRPQRSAPLNYPRTQLVSNFYPFVIKDQQQKHCIYSFDISPEIPNDARKKRQFLIKSAQKKIEDQIGQFWVSGFNMYSNRHNSEPFSVESEDKDGAEYKISIQFKFDVDLNDIYGQSEKYYSVKQFFEIMIKNTNRELNMIEIGRNSKFYDMMEDQRAHVEQTNVSVIQGFLTSVDLYQKGLFLQIDFVSRCLQQDTILDYIFYLQKEGWKESEIKQEIIGKPVIADYGNFRIYKVTDVDFTKSPMNHVQINNEPKTLIEYYKKAYSLNITNTKQPLLVYQRKFGAKDDQQVQQLYLIPELCKFAGLLDEQKNDTRFKQKLAKYTKLDAQHRFQKINDYAEKMKGAISKNKNNITLEQPVVTQAYQLRDLAVEVNGELVPVQDGNYLRSINKKIEQPAHFNNWVLMYNNFENAKELMGMLQQCAKTFGITFTKPMCVEVKGNRSNNFTDALARSVPRDCQIVVALLDHKTRWVYADIKNMCLNQLGVASQCMLTNTLKKGLSAVSGIILQMNVKVGLPIWNAPKPQTISQNTMLIGADVHHKTGKLSTIGFVASMDERVTQYMSLIEKCKGEKIEIMDKIGSLVERALRNYYRINRRYPDTIIFYRDGVSEGQFQAVLEYEVKQILNCFKNISQDGFEYNPQFMEIIVQKRISERFFSKNQRGLANPQAGTVVCEDTVSAKYWDFYLVAQRVTQGSCTPSKYTVLYNNTDLQEQDIIELTFGQCANYYNWQGTIKIPAVVKYADLLAYFVATSLESKQPVSEKLVNQLYYL